MRSNLFRALAVTLASGILLAACGEEEVDTPVGCFDGAASFQSSLRQAPGEVLLGGETPISDCLPANQADGDLANFGQIAVKVATRTGAAVAEPGPAGIKAAIDAGYLVGAIEKGAEGSSGIHTALLDRVRSAATNRLSRAGASKREHYEAGYEAGLDIG